MSLVSLQRPTHAKSRGTGATKQNKKSTPPWSSRTSSYLQTALFILGSMIIIIPRSVYIAARSLTHTWYLGIVWHRHKIFQTYHGMLVCSRCVLFQQLLQYEHDYVHQLAYWCLIEVPSTRYLIDRLLARGGTTAVRVLLRPLPNGTVRQTVDSRRGR